MSLCVIVIIVMLSSRLVKSVDCEEIHSGRLQMIAACKASTEQLIMERNVT